MIGDVMGHGPQAAARMGQLRAVLAAYAYDGDPPDRVLAHVSARATALLDLPMATVMAAIYDPRSRRLTFALAGHLPPLVAPLDGLPAFVGAAPGPPLGAGVTDYERHVIDVPEGATIVLYTDGLIEDRTRSIDVGLEQLRAALIERAAAARSGLRPRAARAGAGRGRRGRHRAAGHEPPRLTAPSSRPGEPGVLQPQPPAAPDARRAAARQVVVGAQLEPALAPGSGTGRRSAAARLALDLDAPARRRARGCATRRRPPARRCARTAARARPSRRSVQATTAVGATPWMRPPAKATPGPWPHHQWSANAAPQFFSA